jgi:hypothetical protein
VVQPTCCKFKVPKHMVVAKNNMHLFFVFPIVARDYSTASTEIARRFSIDAIEIFQVSSVFSN